MVWWREFFGCASGYPCPTITPKKGEIPASMMTRGGGLKRFCSELISSLRKTTTSELASPGLRAPPTRCIRIHLVAGWRLSYTDSLPGLFPGPFREERGGENNAVFVIDQSGGYWPIMRTVYSSTLSTVRTPVDVAGVEPARYNLSTEAHPMICFSEA